MLPDCVVPWKPTGVTRPPNEHAADAVILAAVEPTWNSPTLGKLCRSSVVLGDPHWWSSVGSFNLGSRHPSTWKP